LHSLDQEQCFEIIKVVNKYLEECIKINKKGKAAWHLNVFAVEGGLEPFINVMVQSLVFGPVDVFEEALQTYEYALDHTPKEALDHYVMKLVGPLIRVSFYKYETDLKQLIIKNILKFDEKGVSLLNFLPQLQTTFMRLINDYNGDKSYIKDVAKGLNMVIKYVVKKDSIYNDIFNKFWMEQNSDKKFAYMYCVYYLTKVNIGTFSKALLDIVLEKLFNFAELNPNDTKIRYVSKTIAIITSQDALPKQKELVKKLVGRVSKSASDDSFYLFSHFLHFLKKIDSTLVTGEIKEEEILNILSVFFKATQLRHNIVIELDQLRKLAKIDKTRLDWVKKFVSKNDLNSILSNFLHDEEVAKALENLNNSMK
jgi:hypothetical protein